MFDDHLKPSESKRIQTEFILTPEYNNFLIKKAENNTRKHNYFHPSAFGGCLRKIVLQYFGEIKPELKEPKEIDPRVERIFDAGHSHHHRMQNAFANMGILRGYWKSKITGKVYGTDSPIGIFRPNSLKQIGEEKFSVLENGRRIEDLFEYEEISVENEEFDFKGHCDGVIELSPGDEDTRYVVDFKTCKSEKFAFLSTKTRKPDAEYITQINIYMWILGIKNGIIFYEEKNTHEIMEFHVPYDEVLIEEIKKNAKRLQDFIKDKKIPKVPDHYSEDKKPCGYCGYKSFCFKKK